MKCGVRQVCILSPVLFLVVIGDIINSAIWKHNANFNSSGIRWTISTFLQHLDYADDICLLSHSVLHVAEMLYSIEKEASSAGLNINVSQTKSMHICRTHAQLSRQTVFSSIEALLKPLSSSIILGAKYVWMVEVMQSNAKERLEC